MPKIAVAPPYRLYSPGGGLPDVPDTGVEVTAEQEAAIRAKLAANPRNRIRIIEWVGDVIEITGSDVATRNYVQQQLAEQEVSLTATLVTRDAAAEKVTLQQLEDQIRRGKGGIVGTSGRPVISFRFDHQLDPFLAKVQPLMWARRLPYSIGLVTGSVENPAAAYEPTTTTWAQVRTEIYDKGGELWAHSRTHGDPATGTEYEDYYAEIVGSRDDIEAHDMSCLGFQQPGGPSTYGNLHTTPEAMETMPGRIIRDNFPLYESQLADTSYRFLPTNGCRGLNHLTMDAMTVAEIKGWIDKARGLGAGLQLMLHAKELDVAGKLTTAGLAEVLDYVAALRDNRDVEVLTASGLAFADLGSDNRPSLIPNSTFEGLTTATPPISWATYSGDAWSIRHDGDVDNVKNYLRLPAGRTTAAALWKDRVDLMGAYGHTFELRAWARVNGAGNYTVQIRAQIPGLNYTVIPTVTTTPTPNQWVYVRVPFTMPPPNGSTGTDILLSLGGTASLDVDWLNPRIVAV